MPRRGRVIPFPESRRPTADTDALVEIHRCDQAEAMVVKSLLESEGIPTLLRSRLVSSVHPFTVGSQGEVVILVTAREAARAARRLVRLVSKP
jgi:Putative prokaryotic signal transducing protein